MATIAAMPSTMDVENSSSLRRLRRLSRQAMRKNQFAGGARDEMENGAGDFQGGRFSFTTRPPSEPEDALGAGGEFEI